MATINNVNVTPVSTFSNRATPANITNIIKAEYVDIDSQSFLLGYNTLTGDYEVLTDSDGWLTQAVSDANGKFSVAQVLSLVFDSDVDLLGLRVVGDAHQDNYPVDMDIKFTYISGTSKTLTVAGSTVLQEYQFSPAELNIVQIDFIIRSISKANAPVQIANIYNLSDLNRSDTVNLFTETESSLIYERKYYTFNDTVILTVPDRIGSVKNSFTVSDPVHLYTSEESSIVNAHEVLRRPSRRVYGRVYITYINPMLDNLLHFNSSNSAHTSSYEQLLDGLLGDGKSNYFTLYQNDLTGGFKLSSDVTHYGWVSSNVSTTGGGFVHNPWVEIEFSSRLLADLTLNFDNNKQSWPTRFNISIYQTGIDTPVVYPINNFTGTLYNLGESYSEVYKIRVEFIQMNKVGFPAILAELQALSQILYQDENLISIDFLEELSFDDSITTLGNASANQVIVTMDNQGKEFFYDNPNSKIRQQLKKNRKVVPWLGVEFNNKIEWQRLGTFWSDQWDVPVESLLASVTAYDTLYVLDKLSFYNHAVYKDKSITELLEIVLNDALSQFALVSWKIDPIFSTIIIPYAWFGNTSHTQALKRITGCGLINLYCDREGSIVVSPRKTNFYAYVDTWSDATNVISKNYPSMYSLLPNRINVAVNSITEEDNYKLLSATDVNIVDGETTVYYSFTRPCLNVPTVSIDKDSGVEATYETYGWGLILHLEGAGELRSIEATGLSLVTYSNLTRYSQDLTRITEDGLYQASISHDFIQTAVQAQKLSSDILQITADDNYYVDVEYLGDPVDTLDNIIKFENGIAPSDRYVMARNKLFFDGSLIGQATLIT